MCQLSQHPSSLTETAIISTHKRIVVRLKLNALARLSTNPERVQQRLYSLQVSVQLKHLVLLKALKMAYYKQMYQCFDRLRKYKGPKQIQILLLLLNQQLFKKYRQLAFRQIKTHSRRKKGIEIIQSMIKRRLSLIFHTKRIPRQKFETEESPKNIQIPKWTQINESSADNDLIESSDAQLTLRKKQFTFINKEQKTNRLLKSLTPPPPVVEKLYNGEEFIIERDIMLDYSPNKAPPPLTSINQKVLRKRFSIDGNNMMMPEQSENRSRSTTLRKVVIDIFKQIANAVERDKVIDEVCWCFVRKQQIQEAIKQGSD